MADINVEEVLQKLTVAEKVDLLAGTDFWHTKSLPKHGIPALRLSDGPNGVRGTKFFNGIRAACFPCGTSLGSTFNRTLLEEAGKKMGEEAKLKGAHVILGPTINIQRSPLGGRGFESIGEDPVLAGEGAAALVRGIQSTGVQATAKHYVGNDQEHKRNAVQSIITDRALREIYALAFQICIRDSSPGAIMTGYNGVNGTYCSENPKLLEQLLRGEWGWKGLVMSDWFGTYSTTDAALAGLDLEMPGPPRFRGEALLHNVSTDKVREHILDERVRAVLNLVKSCAASGVPENAEEKTGDTPETAELLRRIGNEGIVLLKNEKGVLPLKKDKKTVVIGPNAKVATYHGGGSASLAAYYAVTPFDGISSKLQTPPEYSIGAQSHKLLPLLGNVLKTPSGEAGMLMKVYNEDPSDVNRACLDEVVVAKTELLLVDYYNTKLKSATWYADFEGTFVAEEDREWEMSLIVQGTAKLFVNGELVVDNTENQTKGDAFFGMATIEEKGRVHLKKGVTYNVKVEFGSAPTSTLSEGGVVFGGGCLRMGGTAIIDPKEEIAKAAALAKDADQVIVCAGLNADWETEGNDRDSMDLPGYLDEMIAAVADANPNTVVVMQSGTPVTMPWIEKVPALVQAWYGGNETGNSIADIVFGDANPSGKLSLSFPVRLQDNPAYFNIRAEGGRTLYGEDVYVGYRYYEYIDRPVLFPFGHGLSYTSFEFSDLSVEEKDGKVSVKVSVKNTGDRKGAEVVQVYVAPRQKAKINRPFKEMKGFEKVELEAGESKGVTVEVETKYAVSYWDEERSKWCAEKGEYDVVVSNSSAAKEGQTLKGSISVGQTFWWTGL
ncbi:related to beta-glucosidase [Cephalotrichum gorgonifer]|uniref:beta-glucosidase n=1 Tax=Cephalotrichum gorgonifer TaxID=2041049 RepID=A0AAE8MS99_9PEZI|nr:related to beta-glucosidase [Cephalotrichum gorgonifer]